MDLLLQVGYKICTWAWEFNGGLISNLIQPHMKPNKPKTWLKPWFWPIFGLQQYVGFQNHVYKGKVQWKNKNSKNFSDRVHGSTKNLWNRTLLYFQFINNIILLQLFESIFILIGQILNMKLDCSNRVQGSTLNLQDRI